MTPRFFAELCRQHEQRVEHDEFMLAQIASLISHRVFKKGRAPEDLMPTRAKRRGRRKTGPLSAEERERALEGTRNFFNSMIARQGVASPPPEG